MEALLSEAETHLLSLSIDTITAKAYNFIWCSKSKVKGHGFANVSLLQQRCSIIYVHIAIICIPYFVFLKCYENIFELKLKIINSFSMIYVNLRTQYIKLNNKNGRIVGGFTITLQ